MIIAAHAGTGKTTLAKMYPHKVIDFVAMPYKYELDENCPPDEMEKNKANFDLHMRMEWPHNYVDAIIAALPEGKILLIPPAQEVLVKLKIANIPYTLCYPKRSAKEVYRQRYIDRGNSEGFMHIFIDYWDSFMDLLENDTYGVHIVLEPHQYLSDVVFNNC
jgi:hypothetical protein